MEAGGWEGENFASAPQSKDYNTLFVSSTPSPRTEIKNNTQPPRLEQLPASTVKAFLREKGFGPQVKISCMRIGKSICTTHPIPCIEALMHDHLL